jgi:uncharacterized protein YggE
MTRRSLAFAVLAAILVLAFGFAPRPLLDPADPASRAASATTTAAATVRSIAVAGQGTIMFKPDLAYATFGVVTTGTSLAAVQGENATRMAAVLEKLKGLGIAEKDLQTTGYNVYPQYDRDGAPAGYQVANTVRATIRDIAALGATIDAAVAGGANRIAGITFALANEAQVMQQAREAAVSDARAKAEQYARLTGVTLVGPLSIVESVGATQRDATGAVAAPAAAGASTPIEVGQSSITIAVQISYEIR